MNLTRVEIEELRSLLAKIQFGDEALDPDQEHRFRQLLAREDTRAFSMPRGELVRFAKIVHGLWLVRETARSRGRVAH